MPPSVSRNRPVTRSHGLPAALNARREDTDARADAVTNTAERREALLVRAGRGRGIRKAPGELHARARRDRAVGVADGDDHIPAFADLVDVLRALTFDVDPI